MRTCCHLLINHSRLLGINKQEKTTSCVITIGMATPTGKVHFVHFGGLNNPGILTVLCQFHYCFLCERRWRLIYLVQFCHMQYAYGKTRTQVVLCKSNLHVQLACDCRVQRMSWVLLKHVLKAKNYHKRRQFYITEIVYDFSIAQAGHAIKTSIILHAKILLCKSAVRVMLSTKPTAKRKPV